MNARVSKSPKPAPEKSPLERTAEVTRCVVAVPKSEAVTKRKRWEKSG